MPRVVRSENGSEFCNCVFSSLLDKFGVHVRHGAVGHPQSQGAAERSNQTLLMLIRKTVQSRDWRVDLDMLLFYYRTRPLWIGSVANDGYVQLGDKGPYCRITEPTTGEIHLNS